MQRKNQLGACMKARIRAVVLTGSLMLMSQSVGAQSNVDLTRLVKIPAVSGHEQELTKQIAEVLKKYSPKTDSIGNVYVTLGSGAPQRLIVTPIDEPGYVVSEITADGYLRVQRLPQASPNPVFDTLHFAQPVWVITREGKQIPGVFAGLSVHLQPGRLNPPKMNHPEEMYVDIGARSADEVSAKGVGVLDPLALQRSFFPVGDFRVGEWGLASPGVGDRVGREVFLQLLEEGNEIKVRGTTTIAFVTQQWLGGRGLNRLLTEIHPDEMIYVGRIAADQASVTEEKGGGPKPRSGLLVGLPPNAKQSGESMLGQLEALAKKKEIPIQIVVAAAPRIAGYAKSASLPERFVQIYVPLLWPVTPGEFSAFRDQEQLEQLLKAYLEIREPTAGRVISDSFPEPAAPSFQTLVEAYGASGHERAVRKAVRGLLPEWAQKKIRSEENGNLVLRLGDGRRDEKTPRIAFVAHMDEIGYEVKKIEDDGRLQVEVLGGGYTQYFLGHSVLVHEEDDLYVGGVLELPGGWDRPGFEWPNGAKAMNEPAHVYVGTRTKGETEKLKIKPGDFVTIPKEYRPLLGTRANARSFDDRVGCAALIAAVRALGPELPGRDVTFVWSTEEEVGLKGAAAFAEQAAKENRVPDFVFAIDTFVSSDSPLESKRFADAKLGEGFVVRAVDNSNIVPREYVDRVVALAKENAIPVQYGVTGGGNDGSVFLRYGSVDVALGWPLRYAHSPAEVIDTKDLDALGKIVEVIARKW
ncbi:MAG: M20/M25/M40 family metallo-hydrolase [Candidatus Acidiferrales bacterium]